jgi:hypothetical protein
MIGLGSKTSKGLVWILAILLLVSAGIAFRIPAHRLKHLGEKPVMLSIPLSNFPKKIGNWIGSDINIPATTREYMEKNFADDFFSRRYINSIEKIWADIYVVYCASKPGGILGHRPGVCYPAHGWLLETTETSQFTTQSGRQIECLIQKFSKPALSLDEVVVLSFYILNGQITTEESAFSGLSGRKFNLSKDPSRYVVQVQISSVLESSARKAAQDAADPVLAFLPIENK